MTDIPVLRTYERWVKRNSVWFIPALEYSKSLSMCYAPYNLNYYDNEEWYVGFEAMADVISLYHDSILGKKSPLELKCGPETTFIKLVKRGLSVVEKSQLFVEIITSRRTKDKWAFIVIIEAVKVILRLRLLYNNGGRPLNPYSPKEIQQMNDRSKCLEIARQNFPELQGDEETGEFSDLIIMYAEHGRGVDPHGNFRPRKPVKREPVSSTGIVAEVLHIVRPLVYASLRFRGDKNDFTPWIASLITDLMSILLRKVASKVRRKKGKSYDVGTSSRTFMLLMYLFRAPFYQRYSRDKLKDLLKVVKRIPLLGSALIGPILEISLELVERRYFTTSAS
uniref:Peroxisomal membrane protein PEX16 n=1 Tax=Lotharella oceanica TaxID=641309 RepID=A0A7S2TQM0_9EUKA|mmetsp:Transcript_2502/g.4702  ORF Transcript_2502/g.4702 Transcript_2502/m.4702 type:complete len:337 (+) Transcript_2502:52-1062(+)|eukprot:CAMPEP_0170177550 /NCGR_PEP_ID=MMETSP0040_2-20121228/10506_1 /TAXON_ID=641309 /ORGANISM="Lotharella oceanica, Strain CCMP622" /LENGTH=336 /DNA_ID=CAMNT_0010420233 /DNA_START=52 /DNA_END=1062 /DNA_ORIENTATION=+